MYVSHSYSLLHYQVKHCTSTRSETKELRNMHMYIKGLPQRHVIHKLEIMLSFLMYPSSNAFYILQSLLNTQQGLTLWCMQACTNMYLIA